MLMYQDFKMRIKEDFMGRTNTSNQKYGNKKTVVDNHEFASQMEADFYKVLKKYYDKREITVHPKFVLQKAFKKFSVTYRAITYTGDFQVGKTVYDVKGSETQVFKLKQKMFMYHYYDHDLKVIKQKDIKQHNF
jgi:hypothetical protein